MELVVGRTTKAHGIRGDLAIDVRTDAPEERFSPGASLRVQGSDRMLTVEDARWHSGRLLVRFAGVHDRTGAEALRGLVLVVDAAELPALDDPDEFYDHELEGLRVELVDGTAVGTVAEVLHLPGGDTLAVTREGARELLVPFVAAMVPTVDVRGGRVVIDPPPGLLELAEPSSAAEGG